MNVQELIEWLQTQPMYAPVKVCVCSCHCDLEIVSRKDSYREVMSGAVVLK